jgi:hypothetical protein
MRTMTRIKSLLAGVAVSAIVALAPAANAQNVHFVGSGSSAQFTMAAIAADQAAINENSAVYGGAETVQHWTFKNGATVSDNRDSLGRILPELGNVWLVWLQNGSGTVTDVWIDISVDSTVGVRTFSIQENFGTKASPIQVSGGQIQINQAAGTAGGALISPNNLWPDNNADVALSAGALAAINTSVSGGVHVNVGLTDIRPEDALFATVRSLTALNTTTYAGLGYTGPTANIGAPINTAQGTGTAATPIKFALGGKNDPITALPVPVYTTIPIGAAPIVFIYNNGGASSYPIDVASGVTPGAHVSGQTYPLANLFNGTTACTNLNPAFDAYSNGTPASANITVFLREPLSGTMNTTEFSLFRSFGNTDDSQEVGVINPTRSPYNPLDLTCAGGGGARERSIGTGEVVGKFGTGGYGVLNNPNSIGYIFWGFSNAAKFWSGGAVGADYNYLTLDGVDPLGLPASQTGNGAQNLPNCNGTTCPSTLWSGGITFPSLRNGTYKAWSIYRWVTVPNSDNYGPAAVAQLAQDYVDSDVADFVPFEACPLSDPACASSTPTDGLSVYHSHFTQEAVTANNGSATPANLLNNGNTLGGGSEGGGDEGGLIEGPFGISEPNTYGYAEWFNTKVVKGTSTVSEVSHKTGPDFVAGTSLIGSTIILNGSPQVIQGCPETVKGVTTNKCIPTATIVYVANPNPSSTETIPVPFTVVGESQTFTAATAPGVTAKKQ